MEGYEKVAGKRREGEEVAIGLEEICYKLCGFFQVNERIEEQVLECETFLMSKFEKAELLEVSVSFVEEFVNKNFNLLTSCGELVLMHSIHSISLLSLFFLHNTNSPPSLLNLHSSLLLLFDHFRLVFSFNFSSKLESLFFRFPSKRSHSNQIKIQETITEKQKKEEGRKEELKGRKELEPLKGRKEELNLLKGREEELEEICKVLSDFSKEFEETAKYCSQIISPSSSNTISLLSSLLFQFSSLLEERIDFSSFFEFLLHFSSSLPSSSNHTTSPLSSPSSSSPTSIQKGGNSQKLIEFEDAKKALEFSELLEWFVQTIFEWETNFLGVEKLGQSRLKDSNNKLEGIRTKIINYVNVSNKNRFLHFFSSLSSKIVFSPSSPLSSKEENLHSSSLSQIFSLLHFVIKQQLVPTNSDKVSQTRTSVSVFEFMLEFVGQSFMTLLGSTFGKFNKNFAKQLLSEMVQLESLFLFNQPQHFFQAESWLDLKKTICFFAIEENPLPLFQEIVESDNQSLLSYISLLIQKFNLGDLESHLSTQFLKIEQYFKGGQTKL